MSDHEADGGDPPIVAEAPGDAVLPGATKGETSSAQTLSAQANQVRKNEKARLT